MEVSGSRPGWDEYFIGVALAVSARGDCLRCKVGAVLVERVTHRIISTGYNGSPPGGKSCLAGECPRCLSDAPSGSNYEGCIERHAEWNCMEYANFWFPSPYMGQRWVHHTLYLTRQPCVVCRPYLRSQGLTRVVYLSKMVIDPWRSTEYELTTDYLQGID